MKRLLCTLFSPLAACGVMASLLATQSLTAQDASKSAPAEASKSAKAEAVDCVRYREAEGKATLQTVLRTLKSPKGQTVDLVGVVHIADKGYYEELNRQLETYEAVLYELVGDPKALTEKQPEEKSKEKLEKPAPGKEKQVLRMMQQMIGNMLKLSFQLDSIDYTKPNFVHADMTEEEFAADMKRRGESFMSLFAKAMEAQRDSGMENLSKDLEEMDPSQLLLMMLGGKGSDKLKIMLAKAFDQVEGQLSKMEGDEGTTILDGRNDKALGKLEEMISAGKKNLSIFYGAGHLPGIQEDLVKKGWTVTQEKWLQAWTMNAAAPKPQTESPDKPAAP